MNINNMSGVEFEIFCKELLEKNGFTVSTTATTGDGGIDLVAINNNVFFKGKYIVQCKRYSGSVGEPIIRDLYGVVMAERANKGILITTGTFTASASSFAKDKQIELIDGVMLSALYENVDNLDTTKNDLGFLDTQKYNYFIEQMNKKDAEYSIYSDYLMFLMSYIIDLDSERKQPSMLDEVLEKYSEMNDSDIDFDDRDFSEIISYLNKINNSNHILSIDNSFINTIITPQINSAMDGLSNHKVCKTKTGKAFLQLMSFKYSGFTQLLKLDIAIYISIRIQFMKGSSSTRSMFNWWLYRRWSEQNPAVLNSCEISNIISLLTYLRMYDSVEKINNSPIFSTYRIGKNIDFINIHSSGKPIIIYPAIKYYKDSKPPQVYAPYENRVDFSEYFEKNLTDKIREQQIEKIRIALDSLLD